MTHDFAMLCTVGFKVLSREIEVSKARKLKSVIGRCRRLNEERVRIVHGVWILGRRADRLMHVSRTQLSAAQHYKEVEELVTLADEAANIQLDLSELVRAEKPQESV